MAGKKTLIKKMLPASNLSNTDPRFKKTVLLKILEEDFFTATIPESMLETLEVIEELNRRDGSPVSPAMSAAYCAIAVECTLKYLQVEVSISKNPAYHDAVERIWRGRVRHMEPFASGSGGEGSLLFSAELKRWKNDIEASLVDSQLRERFAEMNTRRDAINKLKAYFAEAWADLGPSFLELAASLPVTTNKGFVISDAQPATKKGTDIGAATHTNEFDGHEELGVTSDKVAPIEIDEENQTTTATDVEEVDPSRTCRGMERSHCEEVPPVTTETSSSKVDSLPSPQVQEETLVRDAPHETRFHLPSPKTKKMSPLKKYEPVNVTRRRKPKKWSALEEETLRSAVDKFGEGNWKLILNSHVDIFDERTPTDLKDKWRNMMRYGAK